MNKLTIKAKNNERVYKKGDTVELNIEPGVNYIVGPNGCGKSTLLHAVRAYKDSIYENMSPTDRVEIARNLDLQLYQNVFDVKGLDIYSNVFCLDAHVDNPVSFMNAGSATSFIHSGGMTYNRISRGEGSKMMLSKFINDMQNLMKVNPRDKSTWPSEDNRSLIIMDELDEGLDLKCQMTFHRMLSNISKVFNADVICVCHNPICILADTISNVYDMGTREYKSIHTYIKEQTGKQIIIKNITNDKD